MGLKDSLKNDQQKQMVEAKRELAAFNQPMPESLVKEIATTYFQYIESQMTELVNGRNFKYYKGMFGGKTDCRYEIVLEFGPKSVLPVNIRANNYIRPWYEDYSGLTYVCWTLSTAERMLSYLTPLLRQEGIRTKQQQKYNKGGEYMKSHYYIEYIATIPCDSKGVIK